MSTRFNHLNVPNHWEHYWTKYPEGYTILEALLNWVAQVDQMVDNVNEWNTYLEDFVETFDEKLKPHVRDILREMEADGSLAELINEVIFGELNDNLNHRGLNVKLPPYNATGGGTVADTSIIQQAINDTLTRESNRVYVPRGTYLIDSTLTVPDGVEIVGDGEWSTQFIVNTNTFDVFDFEAGSNRSKVMNIGVESTAVQGNENACFNMDGAFSEGTFSNIRVKFFKYGFKSMDAFWMNTLHNVRANECGWTFYNDGSNGTSINNLFSHCYSDRPTIGGFRLRSFKNTEFLNCNFGGRKGFDNVPTRAVYLTTNSDAILMTSCNFEHHIAPVDGMIYADGSSSLTLSSCIFPNIDGLDSSNIGFLVHSAGSAWIKLENCRELGSGPNVRPIKSTSYGRIGGSFNDPYFDDFEDNSNSAVGFTWQQQNGGRYGFPSTDGVQTVFRIPHGIKGIPDYFTLVPETTNARGDRRATVDESDIIITFDVAPYQSVEETVKFSWSAHKKL